MIDVKHLEKWVMDFRKRKTIYVSPIFLAKNWEPLEREKDEESNGIYA